jgi:hypothetical protein
LPRPDFLSQIRGLESYSSGSQLVLLGYYLRRNGHTEFTPADLQTEFQNAVLPLPVPSLASALSEASSGKRAPLVRVEGGRFSLSADGLEQVENLLREIGGLRTALEALQNLTGIIAPEADHRFLPEVRQCVEVGSRRAIVVMMWLLTVDHLERYVMAHALPGFNAAMALRSEYTRTGPIRRKDDFGELRKEQHFVEILGSSGIITRDVKRLLEEKLGFRNSCAHPNALLVSDAKVVSFVEDLVFNVILRLPL